MMKEHCQFNGFSIKIDYSSQRVFLYNRAYSRVALSGGELVAAEILH